MSEQNEIQPSPQDVVPVTKDLVKPKEMDLDTARTVLRAVLDTHEDTLTGITENIGGYSTEQIRQAERIVANDIVNQYGSEPMPLFPGGTPQTVTQLRKTDGILSLFLSDDRVTLAFDDLSSSVIVQNTFALKEVGLKDERGKHRIGFRDTRPDQDDSTKLSDLEKTPTLDRFKNMVRGVRWMNANLLDWDKPGTVMPEQLDKPALPSAQHLSPKPI